MLENKTTLLILAVLYYAGAIEKASDVCAQVEASIFGSSKTSGDSYGESWFIKSLKGGLIVR